MFRSWSCTGLHIPAFRWLRYGTWAGVLLGCWIVCLGEQESASESRAFREAQALHRESPGDAGHAWRYARACFDRAESLASRPVKVSLAKEGIQACQTILKASPAEAPCHYYLGLNLGILAQAQPWKALGWIRDMESHWQDCRVLDPAFDHAGADRSLGMLYEECPPPPLGVGSRSKARLHLSKAVELAPGYPENRLLWIEFLLRHGDKQAAIGEYGKLESLLPEARTRFTGDSWEAAWKNWDLRIRSLQTKLGHSSEKALRNS